jgi:hypothetical protein
MQQDRPRVGTTFSDRARRGHLAEHSGGVFTAAAQRSCTGLGPVVTPADLAREGWSDDEVRAQIAARRWQRHGRAVVLHGGPPTPAERRRVVLLNCGKWALLTAFTAAEVHGLRGWERPTVHVLVPAGTRVRDVGESVRPHYVGDRAGAEAVPGRALHRCAPALVLAASTFAHPRAACGIVAAGVQQRLVTTEQLRAALERAPRTRHRRQLAAAVDDIGQGAHAMSEIDFGRLCRHAGLPAPTRQAVRVGPGDRRRYLDAEWIRADGRRVVAEVDGALHLSPRRWWDDQLRQNELVIADDIVLRFPSVVVRTAPADVVAQLRRVLT